MQAPNYLFACKHLFPCNIDLPTRKRVTLTLKATAATIRRLVVLSDMRMFPLDLLALSCACYSSMNTVLNLIQALDRRYLAEQQKTSQLLGASR